MSACIHMIHGFTQKLSIIVVVHELRVLEGFRRTFSAEVSCNHGIGCAGWNTQVILEYIPLVVFSLHKCYPAFYLVLNHTTFNQIKKRHSINYSDGFYIGLLYAVPLVLS